MLNLRQIDIIKATVPVLEAGGETLTTHFYRNLLRDYPQVRPLFNPAHQASGAQPRALANGVLMYARHIDRLEALGPLAAQIVSKHVSLQILPEHYPLVGASLLQAMREVLGEEIASDAVIEAWAAAYQQLADLLIGAERQAYDALADAPGGWRGARAFKVMRKVAESTEVASFYLEPVDGQALLAFTPGQSIGMLLDVDGTEVRRTYSLSAAPNGRSYRISVKRQADGVASNYLHDRVDEGARLSLFPPSGGFTLVQGERPLVLIGAGVGITPLLAMAEATLSRGERQIVFIHYARNAEVQAFADVLDDWSARHPQFTAHVVHEHAVAHPARPPAAVGRASVAQLQAWLPAGANVDAYFLGPPAFMGFIQKALSELGVPEGQARHEFFGPVEPLG